ncbi:MAG: glycosyltransferase [Candidatus Micrarchaeia archaeon]
MKPKISFALTTLNEEENVASLLKSILNQSTPVDEIIVVDAGSTDNTIEKIKKFKTGKTKLKIIVEKGATIGRGRNLYLQKCTGDYVFTADASTVFERNWVKKLLIGFEKGADIVAGKYVPMKPENMVEAVAAARFPDFDSFSDEDWKKFLPSNRQIAYTKKAWKTAGPYPEKITRSDDTIFHTKAKKLGLKYYYAKNARVFWSARKNLSEYLQKAFQDSESDALAGILFRRTIEKLQVIAFITLLATTITGILANPLLFTIPLAILLLVFLRESLKILKKTSIILAAFGGIIGILLFLAHATGSLSGIIKKTLENKNN